VSAPVERLRALPLFDGLSEDALARLAAVCGEVEAPAGQTLIERGHPGAGLLVVEDGVVVVETHHGEVELGPGEPFGELALIGAAERRTARVRARTDVRCVTVPRVDLERLLAEQPEVARRLRAVADQHLADREAIPPA
jgi:CRP-like cAMP-binding protein